MNQLQRSHVGPRLSEVAHYEGVLYLAGQVTNDTKQDITGQTAEVLTMIDTLLEEHGSDKTRILSCMIYLADMSMFKQMNAVWDAWVVPGATPPRATVEAKLASPQNLIEIVITAAVKQTT
ncbi:RidA family protein [Noviherbaspirillum sp. Root189]|uniref:RidA family protein n=1 Tax=Noviherbaspirillum sp. Root189 TaxID=1736487 RepID=UPI00070F3AE8|nr:RidA family protein [Noviherbaspirillum sp. Root189]KRB72975.1 aminoacrylate peracid reductase [Noviherbaspirillum sp. Root189]